MTKPSYFLAMILFLSAVFMKSAKADDVVFETWGREQQAPYKIFFDYDKTTYRGNIVATYYGDCGRDFSAFCFQVKVNLIFEVRELTYLPEDKTLMFNDGKRSVVCARMNFLNHLKPTRSCKIINDSDTGMIGLVVK